MKNPIKVDKHNLTTADKKRRRKHKKQKTRAIIAVTHAKARKNNEKLKYNSQLRREMKRKAERAVLKAIFNCFPTVDETVELKQAA